MIRDLNEKEVAQVNGAYSSVRSTGTGISAAYGTTATRTSFSMVGRSAWGAVGGAWAAASFTAGWAAGTYIYNRNAVRIQDTLERLFR